MMGNLKLDYKIVFLELTPRPISLLVDLITNLYSTLLNSKNESGFNLHSCSRLNHFVGLNCVKLCLMCHYHNHVRPYCVTL